MRKLEKAKFVPVPVTCVATVTAYDCYGTKLRWEFSHTTLAALDIFLQACRENADITSFSIEAKFADETVDATAG